MLRRRNRDSNILTLRVYTSEGRRIISESRSETRTSGSAVSKGRAASRVERREKKGTRESRTRKILLLKMSQPIVARWSHPRRGPQSHSQKFISISRSKTRAVFPFLLSLFLFLFLLLFSLSLSFSLSLLLFFSRTSASRPPRLFHVSLSTGRETEQEERAFISSLLTAMRRKHDRIFFCRSLSSCTATSTLSLFAWLWISAADN